MSLQWTLTKVVMARWGAFAAASAAAARSAWPSSRSSAVQLYAAAKQILAEAMWAPSPRPAVQH